MQDRRTSQNFSWCGITVIEQPLIVIYDCENFSIWWVGYLLDVISR